MRLDIALWHGRKGFGSLATESHSAPLSGNREVCFRQGVMERLLPARSSSLPATPQDVRPRSATELFRADTSPATEVSEMSRVKFGGARYLAMEWGQGAGRPGGAVDTVITNAAISDQWGIVKADIGIKGRLITGIGKAGNPDAQCGHHHWARHRNHRR